VRRAAKRDQSEPAIVVALKAAGYEVYDRLPVDLLCIKAGKIALVEVKTPSKTGRIPKRKDQQEQNEFCERHGIPRVGTPLQALEALGESLTYFGEP
jgi:hypothetical protein